MMGSHDPIQPASALDKEIATQPRERPASPPPLNDDSYNGEEIVLTRAVTNARPPMFETTAAEILFVLTCTMANASTSFVAGSVQVITNKIGVSLHANSAEITWMSASTSLTTGAFLLFFGRVADIFGRKPLFLSSMIIFSLLALATGFAPSPVFLDTFNGLLGITSASMIPSAAGSLGATYSKASRRKNYVFACYSAGNPIGFAFGSVASGIATKIISWRASYWFISILYAIFTLTAWFTVPRDPDTPEPLTWATIKRFDALGAVTTIVGVGLFSSSMTLAGDAPSGWRTPYIIILLVLGILLILLFIYWESVFSSPLMPLHIWRNPTFALNMSILFLGMMSFPPSQFWLSLYMQRMQRLSPLSVAVRLLPQAIMGILVNVVSGLIMHRVSNKLLLYIGAISYTLSFILLALMDVGVSTTRESGWYWQRAFPSILLTVVGADLEFTVVNMYVVNSMTRRQQSMAGGIMQVMTKLSVVVGLGVGTALFTAQNGESGGGRSGGISSFTGYQHAFWMSTACSGVSILMVPFLKLKTQGHNVRDGDMEEEKVSGDRKGEYVQ